MESLIDSIDANHDNQVNFTEFIASLIDTQGRVADDMIEQAFRIFDNNGDGRLSSQDGCKLPRSRRKPAVCEFGSPRVSSEAFLAKLG